MPDPATGRILATGAVRFALRLRDDPPTKVLDGPGFDALWIGDRSSARRYGDCFRVHTVAKDAQVDATEVYTPLQLDGDLVENGVGRTLRMLYKVGPVLVHCHEGRERAPTIVACVVAARRGWPVRRALAEIEDVHEPTDPPDDLVTAAETALESLREVDTDRP